LKFKKLAGSSAGSHPRKGGSEREEVKPDPLFNAVIGSNRGERLAAAVTEAEARCNSQIMVRLAASTPISDIRKIAVDEFHRLGLHRLPLRNGVLFYISLNRRLVEIVAGENAVRDLPDDLWVNLARDIAEGFKAGNPTDSLVAAIEDVGIHLAVKFPPDAATKVDLPNVSED
jgi:uncharacterized membrane protein